MEGGVPDHKRPEARHKADLGLWMPTKRPTVANEKELAR